MTGTLEIKLPALGPKHNAWKHNSQLFDICENPKNCNLNNIEANMCRPLKYQNRNCTTNKLTQLKWP